MQKPIIGITMGDPSGVGPEICLKALKNECILSRFIPIIFGDTRVIRRVMPIVGCNIKPNIIRNIEDAVTDRINLYSLDNMPSDYQFGVVQPECGRAAFEYIIKAIEFAMDKKIDAVVTGPIHKEAMNMAGIKYSGHTEIFAEHTNTRDYAMMLVSKSLKVVHVSTHVSLLEACCRVKKDRILKVIKLAQRAMVDLGTENPKIAVAALNPHGGEGGLFGDEEIKEIQPAIELARREGINVKGPFPADTIFLKCENGEYDIAVAMYHDQGHIPLKMVDFLGGVNVTLGLPIIRTSVDHGTVFGKAGKGTASELSLINAIRLAIKLTNNKRK
jgi:4-hydroxythreonine-4-phosphate dehydrogenase